MVEEGIMIGNGWRSEVMFVFPIEKKSFQLAEKHFRVVPRKFSLFSVFEYIMILIWIVFYVYMLTR